MAETTPSTLRLL